MKVISTFHSLKSMGGFILFALFAFFTSNDLNAQCNTDPTSGPVDVTFNLTGSSAVLNQAALVGVINPVDDGGACTGCQLWIQAPGEAGWESSYLLSCDGSTTYSSGTYQVVANDVDPDTDPTCQSAAVELNVFLNDTGDPEIDVSSGSTPDCGESLGPLNTSDQYDYTGGTTVVSGGFVGNCLTRLDWNYPAFDDNCVLDELQIKFSAGSSPPPDDLPTDITVNGDANIKALNGFPTSEGFASSAASGSAVTTITYMLTDSAGNVTNCSFDVEVVDDEDPSVTCVADASVITGDGSDDVAQDCGYTIPDISYDASASDNCGIATLTHNYVSAPSSTTLMGAEFPIGTTTVTWTATDGGGLTDVCSHDITVTDGENPSLFCPFSVTIDNDPGLCSATNIPDIGMTYLGNDNPSLLPTGTAEWYDNCSNSDITYSLSGATTLNGPTVTDGNIDAGTEVFNVGLTIVEYTITDDEGNTASCIFTVTVEDNEAPVINDCAMSLDSVGTDLFTCEAFYSWIPPSDLQDNCGLASFTCEVTDNEGNIVNTFNTSPSGCSNQVGFAGEWAPGFWTLSGPGSANTSNAPASISVTGATGGATSLCIIVPDDGQIAFSFNVTPFTSLLTHYSVNGNRTFIGVLQPNGSRVVPVMAGDIFCYEVDPAIIPIFNRTLTISNFQFTCSGNQKNATLPKGTNLITYTLVDIHGNDTTCVDTVVVYDDEAPTLDDCDDQEMNTVCPDASIPDYSTNNNVSDNCPMVTVTQSPDPSATLGDLESADSIYFNGSAGGTLQDGAYYFVNLVATDMGGNTDTCRFQVTLNDQNEPIPDVDPLPDINPMTTLGTDCGSYTLCAPTATDCNGTVIYGSATIAGATFDPDGCGAGMPSYTFTQAGVWAITWIYDDGNGNIATQQQSVEIIEDNIAPTLNCPGNVLTQTDMGVCTKTNIPGISMTEVFPTIAPYLDPTDNPSNGEGVDNCGIVEWRFQLSGETNTGVILGNDAGTQTFNLGTTTVTYFAQDAAGNVGSCSFDVEIEDLENPTATCPPVFVGLSTGQFGDPAGDCVFEFTNTNYDPKNVMDNCSIADTIYSASSVTPGVVINPTSGKSLNGMTVDLSGTANSQAAITVNWTITDGSGNPVNCSTNFLITDSEKPVITCADNTTRQISEDGVTMDCFYTVQGSEFDPTFTDDNCMVDDVYNNINFGSTLNGEDLPIQVNIITWTVVDKAGNSTSCQVEVTVEDDEAPKFDYCPDDVTLNNTPGDCSQLHNWLQPSVFDLTDCDNPADLSILRIASDASVQGALDLNWPYDDQVGGFALSNFPVGVTTIYYIAEDSWGNIDTCELNVTILDNEAPVFAVCPGNQILGNICANDIVPDYRGLATVTDNCALDTLIQDPAPGTLLSNVPGLTPADGESFTVTLTATDKNPNNLSSDCSFDVTLDDDEAPVPDVAGSTLPKVYNSCSYVEVEAPTATDCGVVIYGVPSQGSFIIGSNPPRYSYTTGGYNIVWDYIDPDNPQNVSSQSQIIEVVDDTTPPQLTCPEDITMYGTDYPNCYASNIPGIALSEGSLGSFTPGTYADTCTMDPNFIIEYALSGASSVSRKTGSNAGIEIFNTGLTTITYWVTDEASNESTCSFTVMVMDDDAPDLFVPVDVTVQCDNVPVAPAGSANDNCDGLFVPQFMEDSIPGSCTNEYTLRRTWTAVDTKGNSISGTQFITVIDTNAPNFNLNLGALDVTTNNDLNECNAFVSLIMDPADVTDGCDTSVTITNDYTFGGNDASAVYPVGTTKVTFTAEDNCGNSSTYEVDVTVIDNEDPVIGCLQGLAFNIPDTDTLVLRPSDLYFVLRDNCGIDTVTMSQDTFTCDDVTMQFIDVILTATDTSGNVGTCTATVLIQDNIPPVAVCQNITAYLEADGQVTVDATDIDDGSTDNCDFALDYYIGTIGTKTETFDCSDKGLNFRTLIVQDPSGNIDSCTAEITVLDTISPVAQCMNITVALDSMGFVVIDSNAVDNGSSDNCMITEISVTPNTFSCSDIGNFNIVEMVVTDMSGNTDKCNAIVTVIDNIAPVAVCADTTIYLDDNGEVTIDETYVDGGSTDNCDMDLDFAFTNQFSCADTGINMVTVTVTDDYNNSSTCISNVTVLDTTPPIAACMDATLILDSAGFAVLNVNDIWDAPNSSDNCGIEHARLSQTIFDCSNKNQMNIVTLELEDYSGNTSTCEANITVLDVFGPHLECRDITVLVDENTDASIYATSVIDSVFDPCGLQDTTISQSVFDCSHAGDNIITVTATDFTGNISVCQANVRVEFTTPPDAVCQDITVTLGEDGTPGQATISPSDLDAGSEDACGETTGLTRSIDVSSFDCDDIGDQTVTLTITDRFGVSSTCTSTVTVEGAPLELTIADVVGAQGDIITVPITAEQFVEITSLQFTVEVNDPSVARIVSTDVIDPQTGATFTLIDEDTAAYNFFSSGGNNVANGETIATMDVELLGVVGESTPLSFTSSFQKMEWSSDCQENTGNQDLTETNDGSVTIDSSPAIFSVSGTVRHWVDDLAIDNVAVQISYGGVAADTVYTNAAGEYSFTAVNGSSPEICPININSGYYATERDFYLAKTNATQSVTAFDQLLLALHIANSPGARFNNPFELIAADVSETPTGTTCNGSEIDGADIRTIGTVLEGASNWAHESWVFVDDDHTFSNSLCPWEGSGYPECIEIPSISSNQTDLDFNAVKIGDVDGSFDHYTHGPNGGSDINPADLQLEYRTSGSEVEFNMTNVLPIGSFQFALNYNPSETFIESTEVISTADNFVINHQPDQNRILIIAYDLNFDEMGQETLFRLYGDFSGADNEFSIRQDYLINEVYSEIDEFGIVVLENAVSTNVEDNVVGQFELLQNKPNPFNQQTTITWIMPQNEEVNLKIYNAFGQIVHSKVLDGKAGINNYELSLQSLPSSGTYYYKVQTANYEATKSMLLVD